MINVIIRKLANSNRTLMCTSYRSVLVITLEEYVDEKGNS